MSRIQIALTTLTLVLLSINTQIVTLTTAACQPTTTLANLGFTAQAASVVNNGTCKNYYATNGACTSPWSLINTLNTNTNWLKAQALNANSFALQYINATIYFQTQNGVITSSTTVPTNNSWFSSFSSFFNNLYNRATSLFTTASSWLQSVFNNNVNAVNACFQAWSNVTNGAYCVATSSSTVSYITNSLTAATPLTLVVDPTTTGNALNACAPLLDTYCSLTYGISTSNSASPFNVTFNWSDNGLLAQDCYNFRNQTNCTTCTATLNTLWTNLFNSAWIKFVPSAASVNNLGSFLTATTASAPINFKPVSQAPNGVGITLQASTAVNGENVYADGLASGQGWVIYGSAYSLLTGVIVALFALMV